MPRPHPMPPSLGAGRRNVIYTAVGAPGFKDGMKARAGKPGAYPGKLQRGAKKGFFKILAIGCVVTTLTVLRLKIQSAMRCALIYEFDSRTLPALAGSPLM